MTQHEDSWKALTHTHELIRFADTKAAALLAAGGTLGGILLHGSPDLTSATESAQLALRFASLGLVIGSILLALFALVPRLRRRRRHSLLHFGSIADRYPRARDFAAATKGCSGGTTTCAQHWPNSCGPTAASRAASSEPSAWRSGCSAVPC